MDLRDDHAQKIDRLDFSNRCEECAGFCCVALEIPENSAGTLVKTANAVCEYLDLDASWIGHACSVYHSRRQKGFETCLRYRCYGAGPTITRIAEERDWIFPDATFHQESVDLYDLCFRLAKYLQTVEETDAAALFSFRKKPQDEFTRACERIYRKLLSEGILTDEAGNVSDVGTVRNWFIENIRGKGPGFFRLLPMLFSKKTR